MNPKKTYYGIASIGCFIIFVTLGLLIPPDHVALTTLPEIWFWGFIIGTPLTFILSFVFGLLGVTRKETPRIYSFIGLFLSLSPIALLLIALIVSLAKH